MGRAWRELRRGPSTMVIIDELFGSPGGQDSVEPGHLDVLDLLSARGDLRMSDLAAELGVDPSTVTRTLQRMEAAGLAKRVPDDRRRPRRQGPADRRGAPAARGRLGEPRRRSSTTLFEDFDADDRAQLVDLLERFIAAIDRYAARSRAERGAAPSG